MANMVDLSAWAKVNLSLGIEGVKDGFHALDSVMVAVDLKDEISIAKRADDEVNVTYSTGEKFSYDNAKKVALAIKKRYGLCGLDIVISKGVPQGVGVGGSAVDGAGIARGLEEMFDIKIDNDFLVSLGGDIPFLKAGGCAIVKGRGEDVTPIEIPKLYILLVYGDESLSTKEIFATYDLIGGKGGNSKEFLETFAPFNALEDSAIRISPNVVKSKNVLEKAGFTNVVMTGSGCGYIAYEFDKNEFDEKVEKAEILAMQEELHIRVLNTIKES
ncbi:MAG: hypothetical protein J6R44_06085 [Clostridia bacterium]|nr:hypothetical protein [Clostridia bacterium]MBO7178632.1 hypothetical protein [Clostridia bacterium]